ncbi:MAG: hypothetical protein PHF57_11565, partial [Methanoregula sp.]|nr:hypothetical protein [Methanoregula sp.]
PAGCGRGSPAGHGHAGQPVKISGLSSHNRGTRDDLTPVLPGIGRSMDCFAVSLAIGTPTKTRLINTPAIIGICFAVFQTVMTRTG